MKYEIDHWKLTKCVLKQTWWNGLHHWWWWYVRIERWRHRCLQRIIIRIGLILTVPSDRRWWIVIVIITVHLHTTHVEIWCLWHLLLNRRRWYWSFLVGRPVVSAPIRAATSSESISTVTTTRSTAITAANPSRWRAWTISWSRSTVSTSSRISILKTKVKTKFTYKLKIFVFEYLPSPTSIRTTVTSAASSPVRWWFWPGTASLRLGFLWRWRGLLFHCNTI